MADNVTCYVNRFSIRNESSHYCATGQSTSLHRLISPWWCHFFRWTFSILRKSSNMLKSQSQDLRWISIESGRVKRICIHWRHVIIVSEIWTMQSQFCKVSRMWKADLCWRFATFNRTRQMKLQMRSQAQPEVTKVKCMEIMWSMVRQVSILWERSVVRTISGIERSNISSRGRAKITVLHIYLSWSSTAWN